MNSRVFSQGDISDAVYIIKSGIFEVRDEASYFLLFIFDVCRNM